MTGIPSSPLALFVDALKPVFKCTSFHFQSCPVRIIGIWLLCFWKECTGTENGKDQTEAEDIKKRWQEYTEELYKKELHNSDNHDDVITDLEPDILECEVKWALESITTNKEQS